MTTDERTDRRASRVAVAAGPRDPYGAFASVTAPFFFVVGFPPSPLLAAVHSPGAA